MSQWESAEQSSVKISVESIMMWQLIRAWHVGQAHDDVLFPLDHPSTLLRLGMRAEMHANAHDVHYLGVQCAGCRQCQGSR